MLSKIFISFLVGVFFLSAANAGIRIKQSIPMGKEAATQGLYSGPWYIGPNYNIGECKGQGLNRYNSNCYSEFLAVTTYYLIDKLKEEVTKDVKVCENDGKDVEFLSKWDARNDDPDYADGGRKYCDIGSGINSYSERWQWLESVAKKLTECEFGLNCESAEFESVVIAPTAFYKRAMVEWLIEFGINPDDPNSAHTEYNFTQPYTITPKPINAEPYFEDIEPKWNGWLRPQNRVQLNSANLGVGVNFPVHISYSNDKIHITINSTSTSGHCLDIQSVLFSAETEGVYKQSFGVKNCEQKSLSFPNGMGTWDDENKYWYTTSYPWSPTWTDWYRTTAHTGRNNFSYVQIFYYLPSYNSLQMDLIWLAVPSKSFVKRKKTSFNQVSAANMMYLFPP